MKRPHRILLLLLPLALCALIALFALSFARQLRTSGTALVTDTLTRRVNSTCQGVITANDQVLLQHDVYKDEVLYLSLDNRAAALLAARLASACAQDLQQYETLVVSMPRGSFTGSAFLADKGGNANYTMSLSYSVSADYHVYHQAVGINQIRYALYVRVVTTAHVTVPRQIEDITYTYYVPVCEQIYSGQVPNVYVNGTDATNYLDLLPD